MSAFYKFTIVALTIAGFVWLAKYSQEHHTEASYSKRQIDGVAELIEMASKPASKLQRQAEAIITLYSISDDEISQPINLWKGQ